MNDIIFYPIIILILIGILVFVVSIVRHIKTKGRGGDTMSTKQCPLCGNEDLVLFCSTNQKGCNNHGEEVFYFPWNLDKGQIPIYANNRLKKLKEGDEDVNIKR